MITHGNEIKLFSGNSNRALAEAIAKKLHTELGEIEVGTFSDGEINVHIAETVRGRDVFIIQSTCSPVNDNLMELLIMIDAAKRASAGRITAVIPYFGYARQDRKARSRDPITAKLVANLLTNAGADRVLTMDLHADQIQGFFDIPVDNLLGGPTLYSYFAKQDIDVVVAPDVGAVKRSRKVAEKFGVPLAIIDKRRPKANVMEVMSIIGDVKEEGEGAYICIMQSIAASGNTLKAGTPVIVKAEPGDYTLEITMSDKWAIESLPGSLLRGNFMKKELVQGTDVKKFILMKNEDQGLGFYRMQASGTIGA
ncbi:MAG: ribose-phosphate pyrophosphokinase, partial [Clostridia bacterium]|nr:ribose-phosphate pyrophosphokinase [Clostridia bacterium]